VAIAGVRVLVLTTFDLARKPKGRLPAGLRAELATWIQRVGGQQMPPAVLLRGVAFWSCLHGLLSLDRHLTSMQLDGELLYRAELADLGAETALRVIAPVRPLARTGLARDVVHVAPERQHARALPAAAPIRESPTPRLGRAALGSRQRACRLAHEAFGVLARETRAAQEIDRR
jgi:hypothetical protein